jgi:hypothetical protein
MILLQPSVAQVEGATTPEKEFRLSGDHPAALAELARLLLKKDPPEPIPAVRLLIRSLTFDARHDFRQALLKETSEAAKAALDPETYEKAQALVRESATGGS